MIGKLQGIVDYIGDDFIILMTGGVGYKVFMPTLPIAKKEITLWIETIVREDSIRLFGFASQTEQDLFNKLTTVSGVGPKVALAILGAFNTNTLMTAIATGDAKTITAAPGVGKKVAEKIIVELKSKLGTGHWALGTGDNDSVLPDLLSALETLGYRRGDVAELAQKLVRENGALGIEKLVPLALKEIKQ